jgi:hypothetical protein
VPEERLGIGRPCPNCGVRADTLGTTCPACRKPYEPRGLLEWVPRIILLSVVLLVGWLWLVVAYPIAGIIAAGAAFALLVGAIGLTNALAGRRR